MKTWLITFILLICACSETNNERQGAVNDTGSDLKEVHDLDLGITENICTPKFQTWDFNELRKGFQDESTHQHTHQVPLVADAYAKVEEGKIKIYIAPIRAANKIKVEIEIDNNNGSIPGTHDLLVTTGGRLENGTQASYVIWKTLIISSQLNFSSGGTVQMKTCPNQIGQFLIGELIDAQFGHPLTLQGTLNGPFSIIVAESDESLNCGSPQFCDY